jgi:redox-sensitive bicupin YhaK (pirin superfamily)
MVHVGVEIRRGSARFTERLAGRATWHSFSFGQAYDPDNVGFGAMSCHDEHLLARGEGFETHRHSELVIVSWVVSGALEHTGAGGTATVRPGEVAVLRTGAGTEHSEVAAEAQTRFVQVWLAPDTEGGEASYDVTPAALVDGTLVEVARPTSTATLSVARLGAGASITLPQAPRLHVFVARGALVRSSMAEPLEAGDAFRIEHEDAEEDAAYELTAAVPTELLVWSLA